jgi:GntR family transcriptional repressor for pyruvate dehydrogenase complex
MFQPVKKKRIYEEIVTKIKDMMNRGRLKSGDQLPSERELSEVFQVSRSSVREALRALESQGLLTSRQGDGTYVASQPIESLVNPLATEIYSEKGHQMELFEMRRLIEPQLAYLAAERATVEEITEMERHLLLQEEQVAKGETGGDIDKTFHDALAEAAKNATLVRLMDSVIDLFRESREKYLQVEGRPRKSLARHREILNAVKAGDREMAAKVMLEHLEDIERVLFEKEASGPDV